MLDKPTGPFNLFAGICFEIPLLGQLGILALQLFQGSTVNSELFAFFLADELTSK